MVCSPCHIRTRKEGIRLFGRKACRGILSNSQDRQGSWRQEEIKSFVYDNVNLPHLRFYYRHTHEGARLIKEPLNVPDYQIEGLKIICASEAEDVIIVPPEIQKFQAGQTVRVVDGVFKGVIGKVARYHGQQRVAIIIEGLLTIASAYVPSAFLENIV